MKEEGYGKMQTAFVWFTSAPLASAELMSVASPCSAASMSYKKGTWEKDKVPARFGTQKPGQKGDAMLTFSKGVDIIEL